MDVAGRLGERGVRDRVLAGDDALAQLGVALLGEWGHGTSSFLAGATGTRARPSRCAVRRIEERVGERSTGPEFGRRVDVVGRDLVDPVEIREGARARSR